MAIGGTTYGAVDSPARPSMAAIDSPVRPSMAPKFAVDGPAGPVVRGPLWRYRPYYNGLVILHFCNNIFILCVII